MGVACSHLRVAIMAPRAGDVRRRRRGSPSRAAATRRSRRPSSRARPAAARRLRPAVGQRAPSSSACAQLGARLTVCERAPASAAIPATCASARPWPPAPSPSAARGPTTGSRSTAARRSRGRSSTPRRRARSTRVFVQVGGGALRQRVCRGFADARPRRAGASACRGCTPCRRGGCAARSCGRTTTRSPCASCDAAVASAVPRVDTLGRRREPRDRVRALPSTARRRGGAVASTWPASRARRTGRRSCGRGTRSRTASPPASSTTRRTTGWRSSRACSRAAASRCVATRTQLARANRPRARRRRASTSTTRAARGSPALMDALRATAARAARGVLGQRRSARVATAVAVGLHRAAPRSALTRHQGHRARSPR